MASQEWSQTTPGSHFILPLALSVSGLIFLWRLKALGEIRSGERRFTIEEQGLAVETIFDGRTASRQISPWKDIAGATEKNGGVDLRFISGATQHIPSACFADDAQRQSLLSRIPTPS